MNRAPANHSAANARQQLLQKIAAFPARSHTEPLLAPLPAKPLVVVVPAERDAELPLTRQQRDIVGEAHAIASEIMANYADRLQELSHALALLGIGGIEGAALRSIVHACSMARYKTEYRLCQDECARTRIKVNSPLYRPEQPRLAA